MKRALPLLLLAVLVTSGCATAPARLTAPSSSISATEARKIVDLWVATGGGRSWALMSDTDSMLPILDRNTIALIEPYVAGAPLRIGQIVLADQQPAPWNRVATRTAQTVAHTIQLVRPAAGSGLPPVEVLTKGANNPASDGWTYVDRVYWRVVAVIYLSPEEAEVLIVNEEARKR